MARSGKDIARKHRDAGSGSASGQTNESVGLFHRPKAEKSRPWLTPLLWILGLLLLAGALWVIYQVMIAIPQQGMDALKQTPQSALPVTNNLVMQPQSCPQPQRPPAPGGVVSFILTSLQLTHYVGKLVEDSRYIANPNFY